MSKRAAQAWKNRIDGPIVVLGRTRVYNGGEQVFELKRRHRGANKL
jgi:hypothetical protein